MSKLNEEIIDVLQQLCHYVDDSHTEYSLDDCKDRGDVRDRADNLLAFFVSRRKIEESIRDEEVYHDDDYDY